MPKINEFIDKNNLIVIVCVSINPNKGGWKIYHELVSAGFTVYPINPKYKKIAEAPCYPTLRSLPKKLDVVIIIVPPKIIENIVKQCKDLKINKIWMQPGSESEKAISFCKENNIKVVSNTCFVVQGLNKGFGD